MSNLPVPGEGNVDFCAMARAAGYREAHRFDDEDAFAGAVESILASVGPCFVALQVKPDPPRFSAAAPQQDWMDFQFRRMHQEARAISSWLAQHPKEAA